MTTRAQITSEARTWLGTPYRHQGRHRGLASDCIGLVSQVYFDLGLLETTDIGPYPRRPDGTLYNKTCGYLEEMPIADVREGDVLLFKIPKLGPSHVALVTDPGCIIHAYAMNRRVVEHTMDARWIQWLYAAFRAPGEVD